MLLVAPFSIWYGLTMPLRTAYHNWSQQWVYEDNSWIWPYYAFSASESKRAVVKTQDLRDQGNDLVFRRLLSVTHYNAKKTMGLKLYNWFVRDIKVCRDNLVRVAGLWVPWGNGLIFFLLWYVCSGLSKSPASRGGLISNYIMYIKLQQLYTFLSETSNLQKSEQYGDQR